MHYMDEISAIYIINIKKLIKFKEIKMVLVKDSIAQDEFS